MSIKIKVPDSGIINVKIRPNKNKNEIFDYNKKNDIYIIDIKAKPIDNKANLELIKFLKKEMNKQFVIVKGMKSREKRLKLI